MKIFESFAVVFLFGASTLPGFGQVVVYDNFANYAGRYFGDYTVEMGDQIILAPDTPRLADTFTFEYFGQNFSGDETARVRFYLNDGPPVDGEASPKTMIYDSAFFPILQTGRNRITLDLKSQNLTLPDGFTWSLEFGGINLVAGQDERVGPVIFTPPSVGSNYYEYWEKTLSAPRKWELWNFDVTAVDFGAQVTAVPEPAATSAALLASAAAIGLPLARTRRRRLAARPS